MPSKVLAESFDCKRHFDYAAKATFKPSTRFDDVFEIVIPTTIQAALRDKDYSYQWQMAVQDDLQIKFEEGYAFEPILTSKDPRCVMKGVWIFDTKANKETDSIDFKATWLNNDSAKTTTVTYKSTKSGIQLTGIKNTEVIKAPESPAKRSKSACPTCEPVPSSPVTCEPAKDNCCSYCAKKLNP
jgi:hypothetical protein